MKNIVIIEGKITKLVYPSENVTKFTVMLWDDKKPDFIDCATFGEDARYAKKFFQKGDTVSINGSLKNNSYEKDGQKIYKTELYVKKQTLVERAGRPAELTRKEAVQKHKDMWTWLAEQNQLIVENGNDRVAVSKRDYFRPHGVPRKELPENYCYACQYAQNQADKANDTDKCRYCPIDWTDNGRYENRRCVSRKAPKQSLYGRFETANLIDGDVAECARVAEIIANLPERNDD